MNKINLQKEIDKLTILVNNIGKGDHLKRRKE
nr:MAG TPA: hypothetical protein [Caudoviricetes sp.]DAT36418.1 MAG TPA: hypothetical protein [Caudoviricetes sp.]